MTEIEAQALKWQRDSGDIVAIILENVIVMAAAEGRTVEPSDFAGTAGALLVSAWRLAKTGYPDTTEAAAIFVPMLRGFADTIERQEGGDKGDGGQ